MPDNIDNGGHSQRFYDGSIQPGPTTIRITTAWQNHNSTQAKCLDRAKAVLIQDFELEEITEAAVYGGTNSLTVCIRCDVPNVALFMIGSRGESPDRLKAILLRLMERFTQSR